jgi:hypothetical protein
VKERPRWRGSPGFRLVDFAKLFVNLGLLECLERRFERRIQVKAVAPDRMPNDSAVGPRRLTFRRNWGPSDVHFKEG